MGVKKEKYPLVCVLSNGDAPLMAFFEEDKAKEAAVKEGIDYLDVIRVKRKAPTKFFFFGNQYAHQILS